jgi:hypothetical protein
VRLASACALGPAVVRRGDWIGLDWIGLDWIGLDWIGLDWIGLDWIGLSTFIRYMAGLQFEPIGMYCSILYTSGGFDAV